MNAHPRRRRISWEDSWAVFMRPSAWHDHLHDVVFGGSYGLPQTPVDLEHELGLYHGNIFHSALTFPFAENSDTIGSWGVETEFPNVFICGSSARRGGAVSGIPGHNAAMKVLEMMGKSL